MSALTSTEYTVPGILSGETAHDLLASGSIILADVRWYPDGRDPRSAFADRHIRGARFVDLDRHLCSTEAHDPYSGRHPFPTADEFAESMSRLGITDDAWVVAYDDSGGMTASRLVVMLRMIRHKASLLDGGLAAWADAYPDLIVSGEPEKIKRCRFTEQPWPEDRLVTQIEMSDIVSVGADAMGIIILDARAVERFEGTAPAGPETLDPRPGHIPRAINSPWTSALSSDGRRMRSPDELRSHFALLGVDDAGDVIASCGSGVSACLNVLAIEHAGLPIPRLFVPSWSGWASDVSKPAETGQSSFDVERLRNAGDRRKRRAIDDLRAARRRRRLADLEWFEALYRVYLAAFVFGGGAMFISGFIPDDEVSSRTTSDIWAKGPGWLGLAAMFAIAIGLRSGSRGGPLAIEEADVRHLLLAPVDRRRALSRPAWQTARTAMFTTTLAGAFAGYLAARRLPDTAPNWVLWGSLWGATTGLLYVGSALFAHGVRLPRFAASFAAVVLVVWQTLSVLPASTGISVDIPGIADLHGDLALAIDGVSWSVLIYPSIAIVLTCIGVLLLGRQSLDALTRRAALVSQLRFAVTMQDLRTVTLLRRRLSDERSRTRPWIGRRTDTHAHRNARLGAEWSRAWRGVARFPLNRIVRVVMLCIVAGLGLAAAHHGTTPGIVIAGGALFMVGLEILEPLAQEIDQSDRTASYPHPRGHIHLRLVSHIAVLAPVLASVVFAVMILIEPDMWLVGIIGSMSAMLAACAGAAVNIVSGSPDPTNSTISQNAMPPEVAGTVSIIKSLWPVALSVVGSLPIVFAHVASTADVSISPEAAAMRGAIAVTLGVGLVVAWIRFRDDIRRSFDQAISESRSPLQKGPT